MKQYKSFSEVKKESGVDIADRYFYLKLRDKYPLLNKILFNFTLPGLINQKEITNSYTATWDENGNLSEFNPNPEPAGLEKGATHFVSAKIEYPNISPEKRLDSLKQWGRNMKFIS